MAAIDSWRNSLQRQSTELKAHAALCRTAVSQLESADLGGTLGIDT